ncbi:MAG TPA: hypothetical protein GX017_02110, partial [Clostridiales bacterium]|nr:hypothetical protein [Clostridiales bacterium]
MTIEVVVETPQTNPAVIGVTSDTEINDSNSEDLYTVIGSEDKDVIEIISLEGGIIQITVTNDDGTYTYKLSNKMKIVVDGKDGDDNIYFNLTGKSNGLTNLVILGGAGSDTVTTGLAAGQAIDLTGTDILLKAEKVLFDITGQNDQALKLKANNLTVNAAPTEASKFYESQNIKVVFRNVDFEITGNLTVDATSYISNGQEVENGPAESTVYDIEIQDENSESENIVDTVVDAVADKIDEKLKTVVNAVKVSVEVELDTAKISAKNVSIKTANDIKLKTGSGVIPLTVTVADLNSNLTIKGNSQINSVQDIILYAYASIQAAGEASTDKPIPISLAIMVLASNLGLSVTDISKLTAGGDISILAESYIDAINTASKGDKNSGGFTAVTIVNQNTKASIDGQASAQGSNLTIHSKQISNTKTITDNGSDDDDSGDGEDDDSDSSQGFSLKDILSIISSIKKPTNDDESLVGSETTGEVEGTFNDTSEEFEGKSEDGSQKGSPSQLVGAVAVAVINADNQAYIKSTGQINISNQISVLAEALANNIVIADASAAEKADEESNDESNSNEDNTGNEEGGNGGSSEENQGASFGLGVGVSAGIVNFKNYSYIEYAKIDANAIQLKADTIENVLTTGSKAGYNEGNFGLGGAVSIGIFNGDTRAYIGDNTVVNIIGDANTSYINIEATDKSRTETVADASSQDDGDLWNGADNAQDKSGKAEQQDDTGSSKTGVGSGIAVSIFDNNVIAQIGKAAINGKVKNLTVKASGEGSNNTSAAAGAAGGLCIVPVVAVNLADNYVRAIIEPFNNVIMTTGDVLVSASGKRTTLTEANAEAGGENVAIGAAVAIGIFDMLEEAVLDRSIGSASERAKTVSVTAVGVNSNEVTAYAGTNGGQEDTNDDEQEKEGSITDLFGKASNLIGSIRSSRGLSDKDTVDTAKEQKAETTEGTLAFAASVALNVIKSETISAIGKTVPVKIYTGDLSIITRTNKDAVANANSSATNGSSAQPGTKVGIGAAAAILHAETVNNAVIGNKSEIYATGNVEIKSIMEEIEETTVDEDGKETTVNNAEHNYGVAAQSGAGGSVLSIAGAVAVSMVDSSFTVSVDGLVDAQKI